MIAAGDEANAKPHPGKNQFDAGSNNPGLQEASAQFVLDGASLRIAVPSGGLSEHVGDFSRHGRSARGSAGPAGSRQLGFL